MTKRPLACLALALCLVPVHAGAACPAFPPPFVSVTTTEDTPRRAPQTPAGAEGHYSGHIATDYSLTTASAAPCARVEAVRVTFTLTHAETVAPRHWHTCRAPIIEAHESAHLAADRFLIEQTAAAMRRELPFLFSGPAYTRAEIEDATALFFDRHHAALQIERQRLQSQIDSPDSYTILARRALSCTYR